MEAMNPHLAAFLRVHHPIEALLWGDDQEEQLAPSIDGLDVVELEVEEIIVL